MKSNFAQSGIDYRTLAAQMATLSGCTAMSKSHMRSGGSWTAHLVSLTSADLLMSMPTAIAAGSGFPTQ